MQARPLPFNPISNFYKQKFGGKIYKIPVAIADDCPNRRGLKGMKVCVFCDEWGSAAREQAFTMELAEQIVKFRDVISQRFHADRFVVYFQAYTNTFLKLQTLKQHMDEALKFPYVEGLVLGTRPDCISKAVLDTWKEYSQKTYIGIELGVQSFFDQPLEFLARGHTGEDSITALHKIYNETGLKAGIHLIFGIPGETDEQILRTAELCNELPLDNVKLHHLHVLKGTPLEELYNRCEFAPIDFEEYSRKVGLFLDALSPEIYVQRLAAYAPRWDELVAPAWTKDKMRTHQGIIDYLHSHSHFQGRNFKNI